MSAPTFRYPATTKWYRSVVETWTLENHHLHLLRLCCEALDRVEQAREALATAGSLTFVDSHGVMRPRPEIAIENSARIAFARLLRELDLDAEPPSERRRPPSLRSNRGA